MLRSSLYLINILVFFIQIYFEDLALKGLIHACTAYRGVYTYEYIAQVCVVLYVRCVPLHK